jgi:uncharacterized protein YbjT (DUF2867 family)
MRIMVAGGTGLVGGHLVHLIPTQGLTLLGRRKLEGGLPSEVEQCIAPAEEWPALIQARKPDILISALGTTIRLAGSKQAFRAVDLDLVLSLAQAARDFGTRQFMMVSSVGANAGASNFYLKTKGQAEEAVQTLGLARVDIMRPGLLTGQRPGPLRPGERIAVALSPVTDFLTPRMFDRYRSTAAADVAATMVALLGAQPDGILIHHNREMRCTLANNR